MFVWLARAEKSREVQDIVFLSSSSTSVVVVGIAESGRAELARRTSGGERRSPRTSKREVAVQEGQNAFSVFSGACFGACWDSAMPLFPATSCSDEVLLDPVSLLWFSTFCDFLQLPAKCPESDSK